MAVDRRPWGKLFAALTLGTATFVVLLTTRVVLESKAMYESALSAMNSDDAPAALDAFESAVKAYAPGNPYSEAAAIKISLMAKAFRMRGENRSSLKAWEVLRRSILATRHFGQPYGDLLADAESAIDSLTTATTAKQNNDKSDLPPKTRVSRPDDPSPITSIAVAAGLLLWIAGSIVVLSTGKKQKTKAAPLGWLVSVGGLVTWLLAAWIA